ncbi:hypothetical protein KAFR_0K01050 [Kazachstania africana CBS 2517]|uniref:RRM domain-containing protein n=1 Tax=Kazachstania africana (strain ATCC 22294 / BCRC 22015 / CBS 2517 / CECT 1963 / NBRC 1671 / NRRL Y-8276) TaxID=1071382 RepID=H2B1G1_KAZAF|nr:hypothetical protein KAFR_0K01050 [Kazachstania africana CBS 2517]CCF60461.1 hypothetical protein KAFR_0K01050 [Kazachstania africana CBS 2517]
MNQIRSIKKISENELHNGILSSDLSWHNDYKDQAYVFIGGLNKDLTEGDILTIFSQYGVPVDIYLARDKYSGESKGFAFLKYEDQRSTVLAIDNLNGSKIAGRIIQVDHAFYEPRDDSKEYTDAVRKELEKDRVENDKELPKAVIRDSVDVFSD